MARLSVVISAYNNQDQIKDCIKSVKFADEIIVVDNNSTDDTGKLAKQAGATVYKHKNNPDNLNISKNFGFQKAKHDWLLSLDTDERIEDELVVEIKHIVEKDTTKADGYLIPRKNIIFGKWIQHGLWYPDHQLRLFRKGKGKFAAVHQHELLTVKGRTEELSGHMIHYNYNTITQYVQKIDKQYSNNEVEVFLKEGNQIHWYDALRFPLQDFLSNYFLRQAYKDGLHGLVLSILQSFYMFVVFCKIWEKQGFQEQSVSLNQTQQELNRFSKQLRHWFRYEKSKTSSPVKKLSYKIRSKIGL